MVAIDGLCSVASWSVKLLYCIILSRLLDPIRAFSFIQKYRKTVTNNNASVSGKNQ